MFRLRITAAGFLQQPLGLIPSDPPHPPFRLPQLPTGHRIRNLPFPLTAGVVDRCREHPRMAHYLEVARRIRAVMATCTPVVESISIDEAFLDVSGLGHLVGPPEAIGRQIKAAIRDAVDLTASVGIGPNRLVAKIASDFGKPDGLVVVPPEQVLDFLGGQPVGILRGVGRRTLPILERLGLRTVADLRQLPLTQLQAQVGPRAATSLYQQARGIASDRVGERAARRSLSNSRKSPRPRSVARRSAVRIRKLRGRRGPRNLPAPSKRSGSLQGKKSDRTLSDISTTLQPVMLFQTSRRLP
jgi:nucleotidyltransferase/DNA polymerase involved in DNA repair